MITITLEKSSPSPTLPSFHTDLYFDRSRFDRSLLNRFFTSTDLYFGEFCFRPVLPSAKLSRPDDPCTIRGEWRVFRDTLSFSAH
jgi:hypothetical protein